MEDILIMIMSLALGAVVSFVITRGVFLRKSAKTLAFMLDEYSKELQAHPGTSVAHFLRKIRAKNHK